MSSSENELRCNNLKCRCFLAQQGQAVVTTCSHIFCVRCANDLFDNQKKCPACEQELPDASDIVLNHLHPSNDYKATALTGFAPSLIMQIATRALEFWTYQTSQENAFQQVRHRNMESRMQNLERQLTLAQGDMQNAVKKITSLENELEHANRRNQDTTNQLKENEKEIRRLRSRYDQMKCRTLLGAGQQPSNDGSQVERPAARGFVPVSTPLGNMPPQPFLPTPSTGQAFLPHRGLPPSLIAVPEQPRFQAQGRQGVPHPLAREIGQNQGEKRGGSASGSSEVRLQQPRGLSKLGQRRAVGPAEYGEGY